MNERTVQIPKPHNPHRRLLALAGPIVLANLSVPLPGIVDTAVMGHLPNPSGLAAVGLGAVVFSTLYFAFGFLRMSTVALTAQADGAGNRTELGAVIYRSAVVALILSSLMLLFRNVIGPGAFGLTEATAEVVELGLVYFDIRIWGAPAALLNMALVGWLFGLGDMRWPVLLQILTNGINVVLDLVFVFGFGWGIDGVAAATVIAEWSGTGLGLFLVLRLLIRNGGLKPPKGAILDPTGLRRLFGVNRDIFIRTLCLLIAFAHFKIAGAALGTEILAANIVLLIFLDLSAYGLDAFANAAEILIGKAIGQRDPGAFRQAVRASHIWGFATAGASTAVFLLFGDWVVAALTDLPSIRAVAGQYLVWAAFLPLTSVWAFLLDGVFIGATWSPALRNGMIASIALYFLSQWQLIPAYGNDGLWLAMHIFLLARGVTLAVQYPGLAKRI